jgi:hypothetical protein
MWNCWWLTRLRRSCVDLTRTEGDTQNALDTPSDGMHVDTPEGRA